MMRPESGLHITLNETNFTTFTSVGVAHYSVLSGKSLLKSCKNNPNYLVNRFYYAFRINSKVLPDQDCVPYAQAVVATKFFPLEYAL